VNTHKKLLGMGFKKCEPHKKHSDRWDDPYKMVPDTHEMKYQTVNGKRVFVQVKKEHPKWRMFYKLIFNESINIWVDTDKGQIKTVWLEGLIAKDNVEEIYEYYNRDALILESKRDIIKLFPKAVQRDFIINDLFK
jgi:hypothetical protein